MDTRETGATEGATNVANRNISGVYSIDVIVGGQYGSEAKGHVTEQVVRQRAEQNGDLYPVLNIRVAGPNAGHTTHALVHHSDVTGLALQAFAFRQLPVGIVQDANRVYSAIAAGSEIEMSVLLGEIKQVRDAGLWPTGRVLIVDPECTILEPGHHDMEADANLVRAIGSTGKGVGAARSDRLMRKALRLVDNVPAMQELRAAGAVIAPVESLYTVSESAFEGEEDDKALAYQVVIEGTQGYGLGLHAGMYPQCTSSDTRAIDFLAMAGLSPWSMLDTRLFKVWVVVRPYPIRVAGNSGPLLGETTWFDLNLPEERTTVTKKVRRVGSWDAKLASDAVMANGGGTVASRDVVVLALSMADQIDPSIAGVKEGAALLKSRVIDDFIEQIQSQTQAVVAIVTTSPSTCVWTTGEEERWV